MTQLQVFVWFLCVLRWRPPAVKRVLGLPPDKLEQLRPGSAFLFA